jgi:hypothetical protein
MNTYTLKDLDIIWNYRFHLSLERIVHHFKMRHGYSEKEATEAWKALQSFPQHVYGDEGKQAIIDKVIPLAIELVEDMQKAWDQNREFKNLEHNHKEIRKLIYDKGDEKNLEIVLNLHDGNDIISYAALLKQDILPKAMLRYSCEVKYKNSDKVLQVFEGDIFDTTDGFYSNKSKVYIAETHEIFKEVLYTKGKGYLRKGEPNYAEGSFNDYVLRLSEWTKIGNIYQNLVILTDDGIGS